VSSSGSLSPAYPDRAAWGTAASLRAWQQAALRDYFAGPGRDFLAVATPGAGKTTFALTVAAELLRTRRIERVTVVAPTEHLKRQWADAASRAGIEIDPSYSPARGKPSKDYAGVAVTYAGVASAPLAFRVRTERFKTLVILDEVHHAGDALSWGDAVREAFEPATRRLALTGTPFRSDANPIPFVSYAPSPDGVARSVADFTYGSAEALAGGVVRPVLFMAYSGEVQWRSRMGDEVAARLGEPMTRDLAAQALRTALAAEGAWMPAVLAAADRRLTEMRRHVPDAAGMVIAADHDAARAYAALLRRVTGARPTLVLSDDASASRKISTFAESDSRWMVAVRMVSEGVDIPRLAVGVYATTTLTPLFFAQAVGRFVRTRRRGETATVFLPSVLPLLSLAAQMEQQRDHVLAPPDGESGSLEKVRETEAPAELADIGDGWAALASEASFDRVVFDGGEFGHEGEVAVGSDEELDFLGIPGLLDPDQVRELLRHRQSQRSRQRVADSGRPADCAESATATAHERLAALRKELNGLVAAWHHRSGEPHGSIHARLRDACGGSSAAAATADELTERIDAIRGWAARLRSTRSR
jgi:superfamily II DNA or RNA helicase